MRLPSIRVVTGIVVGVGLFACSTERLFDTSGGRPSPVLVGSVSCAEGREGCPCASDGATTACGTTVSRSGDYVTCSTGTATCARGAWGACTAKTRMIRNLSTMAIARRTAKPLSSMPLICSSPDSGVFDPCDPDCWVTNSNATDVDGSSFVNVADGALELVSAGCTGTQCQVSQTCSPAMPTTLTGVVYDPAGKLPVPNALVYVPVDPTALAPFAPGPACGACANEEAVSAVAIARTGIDGRFTLTDVPSTDVGLAQPIPLVVQTGHWRRMQMLASVPQCQTTEVPKENSRLPTSLTDGAGNKADLPKMALVSAVDDQPECLLLKMGVQISEFIPGVGTGSVSVYQDNGAALAVATPPGGALYGSQAELSRYDIVLLPCEGAGGNAVTNADRMATYLNSGGHVFATHFSYEWLAMPQGGVAQPVNPITSTPNPFYGIAKWHLNNYSYPTLIQSDVVTSTPESLAFSQWLGAVGATTAGQLPISEARWDVDAVNPPAEEWLFAAVAPNEPLQFSFSTPLPAAADAGVGDAATSVDAGPAAGTCGRVAFSDFHVSPTDTPTGDGTCGTDAECGYSATCTANTIGTCAPVSCGRDTDCKTGETCQGATAGTCVPMGSCTVGGQCESGQCMPGGVCAPSTAPCVLPTDCGTAEKCNGPVAGTCGEACAVDSDCGGGELCSKGACTGCASRNNCPSGTCTGAVRGTCSATGTTIPLDCLQIPITPEEEALEFNLLDLTSCHTPPPPPLRPFYSPAAFSEVVTSVCPPSTRFVWRRLTWNASVPGSASITFSAQTADTPTDGGAPDWVDQPSILLDTVVAATPEPGTVDLDTGDGGLLLTDAAADASTPPGDQLRLTVTLNPTSDGLGTPTLYSWQLFYDCLTSE